jgi:hypothetical protein
VFFVGCRYVEMGGKDGEIHSTKLDAASLFEAAYKATDFWARLWWFTSKAHVTFRYGEQSWTVSQERVSEWVKKK